MNAVLFYVGTIAVIWGINWYLWDKFARAPGWLLGIGLICLIAGASL